VAATTEVKATTDPTLKSIPPLIIIKVIPIDARATITVCEKINLKL